MPNGIAVIKIEVHTRKTEPEYPGNVLEDFHAESASTQICNLNEFRNIDASQIIYNLYERQNQAPEVEQQCWDQQGCKFNIKLGLTEGLMASWFFLSP